VRLLRVFSFRQPCISHSLRSCAFARAAEVARIIAAGGFVEFGRVNGNLALSRAIGDFEFKQNPSMDAESQIVTAFPDVETRKMELEKLEFLVLACDGGLTSGFEPCSSSALDVLLSVLGIWDVLSNQDVVTFCRRLIAEGKELDKICELLVSRLCLLTSHIGTLTLLHQMDRCLAPDRRASELGGIGCDNMTVVLVAFLGTQTPEAWHSQIKQRWESEKAARGGENDATDGSDDEYTTDEGSESDEKPVSPLASLSHKRKALISG